MNLAAPPAAALEWLAQWRDVGGGVTIDPTDRPVVWFLPDGDGSVPPLTASLFDDLHSIPGMETAVRAIVRSEALRKVQVR